MSPTSTGTIQARGLWGVNQIRAIFLLFTLGGGSTTESSLVALFKATLYNFLMQQKWHQEVCNALNQRHKTNKTANVVRFPYRGFFHLLLFSAAAVYTKYSVPMQVVMCRLCGMLARRVWRSRGGWVSNCLPGGASDQQLTIFVVLIFKELFAMLGMRCHPHVCALRYGARFRMLLA